MDETIDNGSRLRLVSWLPLFLPNYRLYIHFQAFPLLTKHSKPIPTIFFFFSFYSFIAPPATTTAKVKMMTVRRRLARLFIIAVIIYLVVLFLFSQFQDHQSPLDHRMRQQQQQPPSNTRPNNGDTTTTTTPPSNPNSKIEFKPSSFDWTTVKFHNPLPPAKYSRLPRPVPLSTKIQHASFSSYTHTSLTASRQAAVKSAFLKSWNSYKSLAFLSDELSPVTGSSKTTFGGWAATLVDSLDTLHIMGLGSDFNLAASAACAIDFSSTEDSSLNLFETTIRHLGGLLSAYDLSLEPALLKKAKELGDMLYLAFDTPNGLPSFWLDFRKAKTGHQVAGTNDPSASPGSLSLEFLRLAQLTGEKKYYEAVGGGVMGFFEETQAESRLPGMWPKLINFREGKVDEEAGFTVGALADSLYEYLVKMVAILGDTKEGKRYEGMYRKAIEVVSRELLFRPMVEKVPKEGGILFLGDVFVQSGEKREKTKVPTGQHLTCFAGGMFALGGKMFGIPEHVLIGEQLARGCAWAYGQFPTGIMPEIFSLVPCEGEVEVDDEKGCKWDEERWKEAIKGGKGGSRFPKGFTAVQDRRYILRPEAIESVFLLYRMTGNEEWREVAWKMFESVMNATETEYGNSAIADVTVEGETSKSDSMEVSAFIFLYLKKKLYLLLTKKQSFWLAETLKYFYLIFSPPDLISLDDYVFNTEAHPFRKPK